MTEVHDLILVSYTYLDMCCTEVLSLQGRPMALTGVDAGTRPASGPGFGAGVRPFS